MPEKIAIVGGGAAGFFAAIACAEANPANEVSIYERGPEFLTKVRISGGGRCNVTHACFDPREEAVEPDLGRLAGREPARGVAQFVLLPPDDLRGGALRVAIPVIAAAVVRHEETDETRREIPRRGRPPKWLVEERRRQREAAESRL